MRSFRVPDAVGACGDQIRVLGMDWSGASDAGNGVWVADCVLRVRGSKSACLTCRGCFPLRDLPGSGPSREVAFEALLRWLRGVREECLQQLVLIGVDAPPSIAAELLQGQKWPLWARAFAQRFPSAEEFRWHCQQAGGGREIKRHCDVLAKTPFAPHNLRMFRQTYWLLRGLIQPLLSDDALHVLPITASGLDVRDGRLFLLEACPASFLKRMDAARVPAPKLCGQRWYAAYKGRHAENLRARERILRALQVGVPAGGCGAHVRLQFSGASAAAVASDHRGDAIDSVLAAVAASCSVTREGFPAPVTGWDERFLHEACVYY